jgi:hypothetical protein
MTKMLSKHDGKNARAHFEKGLKSYLVDQTNCVFYLSSGYRHVPTEGCFLSLGRAVKIAILKFDGVGER